MTRLLMQRVKCDLFHDNGEIEEDDPICLINIYEQTQVF